jgi:bacterioferritin-associated ferredoxin
MYVCVCKGVTERRIAAAVRDGACSLRDLSRELGVGSACGKCLPMARDVLTGTQAGAAHAYAADAMPRVCESHA